MLKQKGRGRPREKEKNTEKINPLHRFYFFANRQ